MFFAVLVSSLALAIGFAIYDLTARQLLLASITTQSQYAIYAADSGAECALYWDAKYNGTNDGTNSPPYNGTNSAFATSSVWSGPPSLPAGLFCSGQDITSNGAGYNVVISGAFATTTFTIKMAAAVPESSCATVEVGKYINANNVLFTTVVSHGYNTCAPGASRIERLLYVSY